MNEPPSPSAEPWFALPRALRLVQSLEFPRKLGWCERVFARTLSPHGIRWVRTAPGPVWKLDLANPTHRWIVYGCYEGPGLWRWVRAHAPDLGTVVDSGANIGQTVLYFARWLPHARIIAYEPGQAARQWLQEGVAANRFERVAIEAAGLGAAAARARLGAAGGPEHHGSWNQVNAAEGEPIAVAALDDELDRHGFARLDFWKLDVEGYELEALRGAARALAGRRVRAIYMETGSATEASVACLREHGYTSWRVRDSGRLEPVRQYRPWGTALFLAPGHPAAPVP